MQITAIELGSGTGIVAAELSSYLRKDDVLIATDLPSVCPLLEENLKAAGPSVLTRPLAWGTFEHAQAIHKELSSESSSSRPFTHILCSDLVSSNTVTKAFFSPIRTYAITDSIEKGILPRFISPSLAYTTPPHLGFTYRHSTYLIQNP
jgi:hypothetical protein